MVSYLPADPDIKRQLQQQLFNLTPRAFEFFAGDFLPYTGLQNISVSRYVGDAGIDASGELRCGIFQLPTGVQVKRHRNNVQRGVMDEFNNVLLRHKYAQGLFLTTSNFAPAAMEVAQAAYPLISTLNGDQITTIMVENHLGLVFPDEDEETILIDQDYFTAFETRKEILTRRLSETKASYSVKREDDEQTVELSPEDDLISLRTLSFELRIDTTTIRNWLDSKKITPDEIDKSRGQGKYYFRRERIEEIRTQFNLTDSPEKGQEWRQDFIDFNKSRRLNQSYKPVMIKAIFKLVDREGRVNIDDLVQEFRAFYIQRYQQGLPIENQGPFSQDPTNIANNEVKTLLVKYPLDRFRIKNFFSYDSQSGIIQIVPQLWRELRYYDILDILNSTEEQLNYYFSR